MMATIAHPELPIKGMTWLRRWEQPFEGGYSLLLKCAWANGATGADLCHTIFERKLVSGLTAGRHGRSLLDTGWVDPTETAIGYMRGKVVEGALVTRAGVWTRFIAGDHAVRYCRTCMRHGYQSALFQIDGLANCPIHGEPLRMTCAECGATTPRYALTDVGFATPFFCEHCASPLGGSFDPDGWGDGGFRNAARAALFPLADWLARLSASSLRWMDWEDWHFPLRWHCTEEERRTASLRVLLKVLPPAAALNGLAGGAPQPHLYDGYAVPERSVGASRGDAPAAISAGERVILYKAIRRYAARRLRGCAASRHAIRPLPDLITISSVDDTMRLTLARCPRAQALALWRFHFEAAQPDSHVLALRPFVLQWPANTGIDSSAWAGFVLGSLNASIAAFDAWRAAAIKIPDESIFGTDHPQARALHMQYAPLLNPDALPSFPAVSLITYKSPDDRNRVLVICPPDIAVGAASNTTRPVLWCRCRFAVHRTCRQGDSGGASRAAAVAPLRSSAEPPVNPAYIVPMSQMRLPLELDGSSEQAARRARHCELTARNDLEAIDQWLSTYENARTRYAYTVSIEKALTWCVAQRGKALSQMNASDADAFASFLTDPVPHEVWLPSQTSTAAPHWSPFRNAPSRRSRDNTLTVLSVLFGYWHSRAYVTSNPFPRRFRLNGKRDPALPVTTYAPRNAKLSTAEWAHLWRAADPDRPGGVRLIVALAYFAGLLPTEIASLRLGNFKRVQPDQSGHPLWSVAIEGRPARRREVFLLPVVKDLLTPIFPADPVQFQSFVQQYGHVGLTELTKQRASPVRSASASAYAGNNLGPKLASTFADASDAAAAAGDSLAAGRLRRASLSWVSGAFEIHLSQAGVASIAVWNVIAAQRLIPTDMRGYLPDRNHIEPTALESDMRSLEAIGTA